MKTDKTSKLFVVMCFITILFFGACKHDPANEYSAAFLKPEQGAIPDQYIVLFKDGVVELPKINPASLSRLDRPILAERKMEIVKTKAKELLQSIGVGEESVLEIYAELFQGFSAVLSKNQLESLLANPNIKIIEQDMEIRLPDISIEFLSPGLRNQQTPCGISNAGGSADGSGSGKWIWILDTGIDLDHPDLNVETSSSFAKSFVKGSKSPDDCHGHGTHCAGIAAAINNSIGVVGVSAGARVVPVRVLGCNGSGTTSAILSGLNHIAANDESGDVVNISLGGYWGSNCATNSSYVSALTAMSNAGTRVAIAAGNSSASATLYTPACINAANLHTIASMTCAKGWSSFSNFGIPPCDWIATGSSVYSTYKGGAYATMSGTSMAAPHVAGIMHNIQAGPNQNGTVSNGGLSYKIAVR
ncbi:MAG: S8 family serine peptidase [Saprospiraceae bacterium]|nr:S8 family serine peptidase [Saprospiraceae bacterium]